jgi:DNA-binding beta-propeller fold protein YncE/cytochrome c peroxidase
MLPLHCSRSALVLSLALSLWANAARADYAFEVYDGEWYAMPDFDAETPVATGTSPVFDVSVTDRVDDFGLQFTGTITVQQAGSYRFATRSDDGSDLSIDGAIVVNNDGPHDASQQIDGNITLAAGTHALRLRYFEIMGEQSLEVRYAPAGGDLRPIPANGVLEKPTDPHLIGAWGPVIAWPHIAVSAAALPDGRVLTFSSTETDGFDEGREFTYASVWNPATGAFESHDNTYHDMFCAGLSMLEDGRVVAAGGNPYDTRTSTFDPATLSWSALADMNANRWYGTLLELPSNQLFTTFASAAGDTSERYDPAGNTWTRTPGATMQDLLDEQNAENSEPEVNTAAGLQWWGHMAVTPDGRVLHGGPTQTWHLFDPRGTGSVESIGQPVGTRTRLYGNAVTYRPGRVLIVGGGDRTQNPATTNAAYKIDLNGASPVIANASPMISPRAFQNAVTLPNGEVLVVGGNTSGEIFSDAGSVYLAEIWNPDTDQWRGVAYANNPRNYHSTALLLQDGRVLSAGSGGCGHGCAANHLDAQIFTPPYLYATGGALASRPAITAAPAQGVAGASINVSASSGVAKFSMVRLSATTHAINTDQRYLPVAFTANGGVSYTLRLESNPNVLLPGYYWIFALDGAGVPSVGRIFQVVRAGGTVPTDRDGDGVPDTSDAFPDDPTEWADSDGDGVGNNADVFPNDPTRSRPEDGVTPVAAPHNSTTLIVETSSGADRIWNVNPDDRSVTVTSAAGAVVAEIPVGERPWSLAKAPAANEVFVANKGSASISVISTQSLAVVRTIALPAASQPHGLAFSPSGDALYVVLEGLARVDRRVPSTGALVASATLTGRPRHLAVTADGAQLYVSNFITPPLAGEGDAAVDVSGATAQVFAIATSGMSLASTIGFGASNRSPSEISGPGVPNYLGAPVLFGSKAYVPSKQDNVRGGSFRGNAGMTFDQTVRAVTSVIDLPSGVEQTGQRIDHDNASVATGAAISGEGRTLFVALETSREVAAYDTQQGFQITRLAVGRAPQGVAFSSNGRTLYVHNFQDRSVSRFDVTNLVALHTASAPLLGTTTTVASPQIPANVLRGKQLFYDAADDRLARDNYLSCASCHNDGAGDGRTWDLTAFGEGLRNTIDLRGRAGMNHGPLHWTGNFDEVQDFESQIRTLAGGTGLMSDAQFNAGSRSQPLGDPKTGLSADLDALAAYVASLASAPASPQRAGAGFSAQAENGRLLFSERGCASCHGGSRYTDSALGVRHDVGTIRAGSGERLGASLDGFDTPTLIGVWATAPYLHDGSAQTLAAAIAAHAGNGTSAQERSAIAAFLSELNPGDAQPPAVHAVAVADVFDTGLSTKSTELATGSDDPHYSVVSGPTGSGRDLVGCVNPTWVDCTSSDPDSQWLTMSSLPGDLTVRTSFTIPSDAVLNSVVLSGRFASQSQTTDIRINGHSIYGGSGAPSPGAFDLPGTAWTALAVRGDAGAGFVHGVNTLDFVVDNAALAAGLRTDDLAVDALPEPSGWSAFAAALPLLALLSRRRSDDTRDR